MKKIYLKKINDPNSFFKFLEVMKRDSEMYIRLIEKKYGDSYKNILKNYGIKKWRCFSGKIIINSKLVIYEYQYPDKDPKSPIRTLSNEWGYFMVFKSMSWRLEEKLIKFLSKNQFKIDDNFKFKINGYIVKVKIIGIDKTFLKKSHNKNRIV